MKISTSLTLSGYVPTRQCLKAAVLLALCSVSLLPAFAQTGSLEIRLQPGQTAVRQLTIPNQTASDLAYKTMVRQTAVSLVDPSESPVTFGGPNHAETLYTTGFEGFEAGEFVSESGWDSEFGSSAITGESPANGAQHLKLATREFKGLYRTRAYSPLTERGNKPFSSVSVKAQLNPDGSGFFAILPLTTAPSSAFSRYIVRLARNAAQVNINSSGRVLVADLFVAGDGAPGTFQFVDTGYKVSGEYVHITYVVDRSTKAFSLFINDDLVHEGVSTFEGDIEGLLIEGVAQEETNITLNVDDVAILDGDAGAPDWIFTSQLSGTVAAQEEATIDVTLDASNLTPGTYQAQVRVLPRDANEAVVSVPVTLVVEEPPVVVVIENLNLTSVCSDDPDEELRWRIRNPNDFDVAVAWEVYGSIQTDTVVATPGDSFFFTQTEPGANTTTIRWENEEGKTKRRTKASGKAPCQPKVAKPKLLAYPTIVQNELNLEIDGAGEGRLFIFSERYALVYRAKVSPGTNLVLSADELRLESGVTYYILLAIPGPSGWAIRKQTIHKQ